MRWLQRLKKFDLSNAKRFYYGYITYKHGVTVVLCCYACDIDETKRIIEENPQIDLNYCPQGSLPALTNAACSGSYKIAAYLLSKGADPGGYTPCRKSALKSAAKHGYVNIIGLLLDHNADVNYESDGEVALTVVCN